MKVRIRDGDPADISQIRDVYYRSWKGAYGPFLDATTLEELATSRARTFDWQRGMQAEDAHVVVAEAGGTVVGVAQADEVLDAPRDLPEITMLYVDPVAWGTGAAAALVTSARTWIADRGHTHARLRVVEDHTRARRFYEREGWTPDPGMEPATTALARLVYYRRHAR